MCIFGSDPEPIFETYLGSGIYAGSRFKTPLIRIYEYRQTSVLKVRIKSMNFFYNYFERKKMEGES